MKDYQNLIGKTIIAVAIVAAGLLIAGAISEMGVNIAQSIGYLK